jgi:tRNA pseudouridine55 synthase
VVPLVVGRATRLARFLSASEKSYDAIVRLGVATDTQDATGTALGPGYQGAWPAPDAIDRALDQFRGTFLQQPPAFSAKKVAGERSYRAARRAKRAGTAPALPVPVTVSTTALDLIAVDQELVTLRIDCSAGFYVRALAHDLGVVLGTGAHLESLRRVRSGDLTLDSALTLDELERNPAHCAEALVPLARMLPGLWAVQLNDEGVRHAIHGRDLGPGDIEKGVGSLFGQSLVPEKTPDPFFLRLVDPAGDLVAIATPIGASGLLHPAVVLV